MTEGPVNKDFFPSATCPGKIEVPTRKERECLEAMKTIKERVRDLKQRLKLIKESSPDGSLETERATEDELRRLKSEWDRWEVKRKGAERERMVALGHEKPADSC